VPLTSNVIEKLDPHFLFCSACLTGMFQSPPVRRHLCKSTNIHSPHKHIISHSTSFIYCKRRTHQLLPASLAMEPSLKLLEPPEAHIPGNMPWRSHHCCWRYLKCSRCEQMVDLQGFARPQRRTGAEARCRAWVWRGTNGLTQPTNQ
jgi:hypothetical protein